MGNQVVADRARGAGLGTGTGVGTITGAPAARFPLVEHRVSRAMGVAPSWLARVDDLALLPANSPDRRHRDLRFLVALSCEWRPMVIC
jgi:hypothetical protein